MFFQYSFLFLVLLLIENVHSESYRSFPDNFMFGVSTSAYQIEGAWNEDGKGESIWDHFVHQNPSPILNNDTGDIACDSYHKYKEDVALAAQLGIQYYRFSISWSRILPTGYADQVNEKGIQYYNNLINEIISYNMIPVATIYHWDLPQNLINIGWNNSEIIDLFVDYARIVIKNYPQVGLWITINEPKQICHYGYGGTTLSPALNSSGLEEYQCSYFVLKAHAKTYHMYKEEFPNYEAKMTITIDCEWYEPLTESAEDKEAAMRFFNFECGIYTHPLYLGDWPADVKKRIYDRSMAEKYNESRLPEFTPQEINYIKDTCDLFSLNHYFTLLIKDLPEDESYVTSYENDIRLEGSSIPGAPKVINGFSVVPWGLTKVLTYIKNNYNNPEILITEVGVFQQEKSLEDDFRINFYKDQFNGVLDAIFKYNVQVTGIITWSLLDNFEWSSGYRETYGFYHVNFSDPNRTRTPKKSVKFFKDLMETRRLQIKSGNGAINSCNHNYLLFIILAVTFFY